MQEQFAQREREGRSEMRGDRRTHAGPPSQDRRKRRERKSPRVQRLARSAGRTERERKQPPQLLSSLHSCRSMISSTNEED